MATATVGTNPGGSGALLAEQELFHLFGDEGLRFLLEGEQAVLVEDHLHPFLPLLPRLGRDVVVDALAKRARPRRGLEAGSSF